MQFFHPSIFSPNVKQERQDEFGCQPSRLEPGLTRRPLALQLWVRSPARGLPASARYQLSRAFTGSSQPGMRGAAKPICLKRGRRRSCPISPSREGSPGPTPPQSQDAPARLSLSDPCRRGHPVAWPPLPRTTSPRSRG